VKQPEKCFTYELKNIILLEKKTKIHGRAKAHQRLLAKIIQKARQIENEIMTEKTITSVLLRN
jgi:hypothetical protein